MGFVYNPNQWIKGDIITAEKLNNIERGVDRIDKREFIIEIFVTSLRSQYIEVENINHTYEEIIEAIGLNLDIRVYVLATSNTGYWPYSKVPASIQRVLDNDGSECLVFVYLGVKASPGFSDGEEDSFIELQPMMIRYGTDGTTRVTTGNAIALNAGGTK